MQVILLERIEYLGGIGDEVKVRAGYARNFLLPQKKALRATDSNRAVFEKRRGEIEARNAEARVEAEKAGANVDGGSYVLIRQAGEAGQLYGSVSARDIADAIGKGVDRAAVVLDKPIKTLGVHPVRIRLHAEVSITVSVNVARSEDEAARQARGENVITSAFASDRADADAQAASIAASSIANEPGAREE